MCPDVDYFELWRSWYEAKDLLDQTFCGWTIRTLGRAGKVLQLIAALVIVLEIIGYERIHHYGETRLNGLRTNVWDRVWDKVAAGLDQMREHRDHIAELFTADLWRKAAREALDLRSFRPLFEIAGRLILLFSALYVVVAWIILPAYVFSFITYAVLSYWMTSLWYVPLLTILFLFVVGIMVALLENFYVAVTFVVLLLAPVLLVIGSFLFLTVGPLLVYYSSVLLVARLLSHESLKEATLIASLLTLLVGFHFDFLAS